MLLNEIIIFKLIIAVICILLNGVVMVAILRTSALRKVRSNKHVLNLLAPHVLMAVGLIIEMILNMKVGTVSLFPFYICLYSLATLSLDRFIAIIYPFRYISTAKSTEWFLLIISWVLGIVVVAVNIYGLDGLHTIRLALVSISFFGTLITVFFVNLIIVFTVRRKKKQIRNLESLSRSNSNDVTQETSVRQSMKDMKESIRLFYACFGSTISMILLYMPGVITYFIIRFEHKLAWDVLTMLVNVNSWCDPMLFVCFNTKLRKELYKMLRQIFCCACRMS